ncbi:uncharacterized protein LY89DRAFT_675142 [Mollisia scopiformis]|uniref:AB hydrolase-1 domain-containing protein n=1 Tax=Mollisia scopiformis TaxID=149040 RepID=A0A132BD08_MOLSC|nr:uncharacterized protein LY89DRAFT_675142 [Mollisia scopiformis]KUJ10286.1 hypothetical protein LY89DRAFT_675142 [Mollisia scopiformis]
MVPYLIVLSFYVTSFLLATVLSTPMCSELVVPVQITANNAVQSLRNSRASKILDPDLDTTGLLALLSSGINLPFTSLIEGSYDIAGRYCEPEVDVPSRRNTLQLLAHPATYDRNYWSGGGSPGFGFDGDMYSWVSYASLQGYPTFAFDRLGNGNSSHPNGITVVQCPAQAATVHEMILLARNGALPFPRNFDKIIFVGESLGSLVGNYLNVNYPQDADATILAGFAKDWVTVIPGFTFTAGLLPALGVQPSRYGNLDPSYLEASIQSGVEFLLFYGPNTYYDRTFILQDYANRGIITLGEAASGALVPTALSYKGPVLVIDGEQDTVFCGFLALEFLGPGNCGSGPTSKPALTNIIYPSASNYTSYIVPNSGHCWAHQTNAQMGFKYSHDWLSGLGF